MASAFLVTNGMLRIPPPTSFVVICRTTVFVIFCPLMSLTSVSFGLWTLNVGSIGNGLICGSPGGSGGK